MLYLMILLLPVLLANPQPNHNDKNLTDVIVTYSNHAEAEYRPNPAKTTEPTTVTEQLITENPDRVILRQEKESDEKVSEEVVFVPNERRTGYARNEENLLGNPLRMSDYFGRRRTVGDVMNDDHFRVETEAPNDVIFLTGKNNANDNTKQRQQDMFDARRTEIEKPTSLNCTHLECNNTVVSVCGGKVEHKQWKYRLFLNECFFRKVNCNFIHEINRYHQVPLSECEGVGLRAPAPISNQPYPSNFMYQVQTPPREKPHPVNNTRRTYSSRRAFSKDLTGRACNHTCPATCPEDYAPECAVSDTGARRMFLNHCKMDFNSCAFEIVYFKRPLSDCVGHQKADMRNNRGFIDWMQRVGMVDNKGRLVLS